MSAGKVLREEMKKGMVMAPFVYDGLTAKVAEKAGFKAVYLTGFGNAASLGIPDVGLITQTEMVGKIQILTQVSDVSVIADADTGYGNYTNVYRTVRNYQNAGAAALHIEDQAWPKRCGYMANKQVIDKNEAASKIKAAVDARTDNDFIIIARTDALAVNGWDDVEDRLLAFHEAGADILFVDGIKTIEHVQEYAKRFSKFKPIINNVPLIPTEEIKKYEAFSICLHPGIICETWRAMLASATELYETGDVTTDNPYKVFFEQVAALLGANNFFEMEKQYKI